MITTLLGLALTVIPPVSTDAPNRQPQLASSGKLVALVYGSGHSILFARSTDGGTTFSKPVPVAELPVLALGRHRGPRVLFAGKTILVSAIAGASLATGPHAHGLPSDGDLLLWRSTDNGESWSKPIKINDSPGAAREGLHAIAANGDGRLAAVWLDLRAGGTRLYGSSSSDSGLTWSANEKIYESPDGTICQCCHPSLLSLGNGEFAVMFRNAVAGKRDMYVARIRDGHVTVAPEKVGKGSWDLNACPMDGGALAVAEGRLMTAWRRDKDVYVAGIGEGEKRIGTGKDVAMTASGNRLFAVWTGQDGVQMWSGGEVSILSPSGSFAALAAVEGGALAAWEDNGNIALRRIP